MSDFSSPNTSAAMARASSVLPTPDGPAKRNDASGRLGRPKPSLALRIASETRSTARSWPMTWRFMRSASVRSASCSPVVSRSSGTPVAREATRSTKSALIGVLAVPDVFLASRARLAMAEVSSSLSASASGNRSCATAAALSSRICARSASSSRIAFMSRVERSRTLAAAPASSSRSIALSGNCRPVMWRSATAIMASIASGKYVTW